MSFDLGQVDQLLNHIPYPISKADFVQFAKEHGANDLVVSMLDRLPDKTFNSPDDIKNLFGNLKNIGNIGGFKL
jgi:mRNA-degrading endonuclease HigB of HigAB toxin-antitoxin module